MSCLAILGVMSMSPEYIVPDEVGLLYSQQPMAEPNRFAGRSRLGSQFMKPIVSMAHDAGYDCRVCESPTLHSVPFLLQIMTWQSATLERP
eukprot:1141414-Pelagomonas_calceolata.AAC.1